MILGAGINGAALARELVLNGVAVVLVDAADVAFGATAYSSRLIHGGLRYLEYGEFDLVRESLAERTRLLRLAPQFVKPLRLFIPIENRFGGLWRSASRFLFKGGKGARPARRRARGKPVSPRGLWLVQFGLRLYDIYARDPELPRHATHDGARDRAIPVDAKYRWLCSYFDAQIRFPERFVIAMLEDAKQAAATTGGSLEVLTHCRATLDGRVATLRGRDGAALMRTFEPAAVVNATGAWVDLTLESLKVPSQRLMGGTKGSHIISYCDRLRNALAGSGLYAEAADGRPVFVLPFGDACLIGTTDERYEGDPADARASSEEIEYLLATVNELLPHVRLTEADIELHYSGVRPLPYVADATPASVTRRHALAENRDAPLPFISIIGGKLTTCRALAEETAGKVLARVGRTVVATSEERPIPGAEGYPRDPAAPQRRWEDLSRRLGFSIAQVRAAWELYGTRVEAVLAEDRDDRASLAATDLPVALVRYAIRHEWVGGLDDLVERRLMLLYHHRLCETTLVHAADLLAAAGAIDAGEVDTQVAACVERLHTHFGKQVMARSPG